MEDTAKYLIHADFDASGVVERSDVVGAVFGQTEGLLGDDLDLRDLQQSSKVGRIDVEVESQGGESSGSITIASSLDRVETAILAASLETISRVGPCRSRVEVRRIEDVRAAKRRAVVDRAKELLATAFDESVMSSRDILEEVRESVRIEDITTYEGLPAGPRVADSDAVIVVEGRADVLTLLRYGIKNAIAVEGTDVPDAVGHLTQSRTVTAFLDGDRGGDLILRELGQVGDVDYVARAPPGGSVEDLSRQAVTEALRSKRPIEDAEPVGGTATGTPADQPQEGAADGGQAGAEPAPTGGDGAVTDEASADVPESAASPADAADDPPDGSAGGGRSRPAGDGALAVERRAAGGVPEDAEAIDAPDDDSADPGGDAGDAADQSATASTPTLADHVEAVDGSGTVRLLDDDWALVAEDEADAAFDAVESAPDAPAAVVLDGTVTQRLLDVAAQRGVRRVVGSERGQFTKQPAAVRVHTVAELLEGGE